MTEASLGRIGKYDLRAEIGRGGFGVVYRAVDTSLGREVALKVLHPQLIVDPEFIDRFRMEAQTAARLDHPNIITIYEYGEVDGRFLIAMRYVPGQSLKQLVTAVGQLPLERVVKILGQLAEALDYAHARGLIHRDVKSANILVEPDDRVTLTDFGLVRAAEGGTVMTSLKSGAMIGTPEYMAPEQLDVDFTGTLDARADVYSLGIVAFEMLAGRVPYQGSTPAVVAAHLIKPVPNVLTVRTDLEKCTAAAVSKALAKDQDARWATVGEFARALKPLPTPPVKQQPPAIVEPTIGPAKPHSWKVMGGTGVALLIFGAVAVCAIALLGLLTLRGLLPALPTASPTEFLEATSPTYIPSATLTRAEPTPTIRASQTQMPTDTQTEAVATTVRPTEPASPPPTTVLQPTSTPRPVNTRTVTTATAVVSSKQIVQVDSDSQGIYLVYSDQTTARVPNTSNSGRARLSPDHQRIAFENSRDGNYEIYVIGVDGSGQTNLTNNPARDEWPWWSPDGQRIAFQSDRDGNQEIYAMRADGTGQLNLSKNAATDWGAVWLSSSQIKFASSRDNQCSNSSTPGNYAIFVVNVDGSGLTDEGCVV